jgi:chromosome partitioning protein
MGLLRKLKRMVISVATQKGGTGKTSPSISLSAGLAHKRKKVLLIDIDSQANSSKVLLPNYTKIPKSKRSTRPLLSDNPYQGTDLKILNQLSFGSVPC